MIVSVFIDGVVGIIGLEICDWLVGCIDIIIVLFDDDWCKDVVVCCEVLNDVDFVIFCLFDDVVCEVVLLIDNVCICVIDVFSVYCVVLGWIYGFFELLG